MARLIPLIFKADSRQADAGLGETAAGVAGGYGARSIGRYRKTMPVEAEAEHRSALSSYDAAEAEHKRAVARANRRAASAARAAAEHDRARGMYETVYAPSKRPGKDATKRVRFDRERDDWGRRTAAAYATRHANEAKHQQAKVVMESARNARRKAHETAVGAKAEHAAALSRAARLRIPQYALGTVGGVMAADGLRRTLTNM